METVPYRNTKLLVQTIPKGTLLFRILKQQDNDMRGVPFENGTRCITSHFRVFFFPNPFASRIAFEKYLNEYDENVYVYILTNDIKVFNLTSPSKYSKYNKTIKRSFMKRCSTVRKGCLPRKLSSYDICFSDTILEKYPNIVGSMQLSYKDNKGIRRALENPKYKQLVPYFHMTTDSSGLEGIPELSLYPLTKIHTEDVVVQPNDTLENNYALLHVFQGSTMKEMKTFMDRHAVFDPNTHFYTYKE